MVTFQTSGYHCVKIELIGNNRDDINVEERFVYVNSNVSNAWLMADVKNDAFEVNETFDSMIGFHRGSNVVVVVEMIFNGDIVQKIKSMGGLLCFVKVILFKVFSNLMTDVETMLNTRLERITFLKNFKF